MQSKNLISISECLLLWAQNSSIELPDLMLPKEEKRKVKIGRDKKGRLLSVDFKYLDDDDEIEIISARRF